MSVFKPRKYIDRKELIENALKDLDPSIREKARKILEQLDESVLTDRDRIKSILKKHGLINQ
ncbi:MAG: hypothetical protein QXX35_02440 [Desulfurococcaceae archaeon]|uniref:SWIRM domain-containing protein n=1 Tax=Staphylothermus marinus TaxID=2280 RepID=A0A7C4D855_STAMA